MKNKLKNTAALALALGGLAIQTNSFAADTAVTYHTTKVDGLTLFYREAGEPSRPTIVLLHGFPSSSHMYRNLIPKLASQYHVIAPDYPGFGYSDQPAAADFAYTFDHLAAVTDDLLNSLNLEQYSHLYSGLWLAGRLPIVRETSRQNPGHHHAERQRL